MRQCNETCCHATCTIQRDPPILRDRKKLKDLKFSAAISPQALGVIIPETCAAIYEVLKKDYLKVS